MPASTMERRESRKPMGSPEEGGNQPRDLVSHLTEYAHENPTACAAWCFVVGFVLGWRLKPW